jgi:hypothetical protein
MNIELNSVRKSPRGFDRNRLGIKAHFSINRSPPFNSTRNSMILRAIKTYVTTGIVLRPLSSSPIGNIEFIS